MTKYLPLLVTMSLSKTTSNCFPRYHIESNIHVQNCLNFLVLPKLVLVPAFINTSQVPQHTPKLYDRLNSSAQNISNFPMMAVYLVAGSQYAKFWLKLCSWLSFRHWTFQWESRFIPGKSGYIVHHTKTMR